MNKLSKPAGLVLVGVISFVSCLCVQAVIAEPHSSNSAEQLNKLKEFHSQFKSPGSSIERWMSERHNKPVRSFAVQHISNSSPSEEFGGIIALNANKRRDLIYDGRLDSLSPNVNSLDIAVSRMTVLAINMFKDGKAMATSNIILNPIQYIGSRSSDAEIEEKLD